VIVKKEVVNDSDAPLSEGRPLEAATLESVVTGRNDSLKPILKIGEEGKQGALSTGQQKFELSRPPIFGAAFRKRRTQTVQSGRKMRAPKWLLVFLLAIAAAIAYFMVDLRSETTKKETPTVALKCWGEIEKICVET
jgi:hypothetical protein